VIAGSAVLALVGILAFVFSRRSGGLNAGSPHDHGEDERMVPMNAMQQAPEGATPCETVYNAYKAYDDAARAQDIKVPYGVFPSRETMIARCLALSNDMQLCLQPRYAKEHRGTCDPTLATIYEKKYNPLFGEPDAGPAASTSMQSP
jgi:hypothetical protein